MIPQALDPLEKLRSIGVLPVVEIDVDGHAGALAEALLAGGLGCVEVTLRTAAAPGAIAIMARDHPGLVLGAGTVRTVAQAVQARDAGAQFIVSPGFSPSVVEYCQAVGLPIIPGVATPTEIGMASSHGLRILKVFPAHLLGGTAFVAAMAAPFPDVRFVPSGGIGADALGDYVALSNVLAVGGSWIASRQALAAEDFRGIAQRAAAAVAAVRDVRAEAAARVLLT